MSSDFESQWIPESKRWTFRGLVTHDRTQLSIRAKVAVDMATRWGMVQGFPDGEDSAGRAKVGLMPVDQVVARAVETTDKLFAAIEAKGWTHDPGPMPADEEETDGDSGPGI